MKILQPKPTEQFVEFLVGSMEFVCHVTQLNSLLLQQLLEMESTFFSHRYRVSQKKDARFSKMKNMPDLLRDDREGKIIDFKYLSNRASSKGNPVGHHNVHILARSAGNAG